MRHVQALRPLESASRKRATGLRALPPRPLTQAFETPDRKLRPRADRQQTAVFSATTAEFSCRNFEPAPPKPPARGGGFVTIWQNGRLVWQGDEENIPARFLQQELDL